MTNRVQPESLITRDGKIRARLWMLTLGKGKLDIALFVVCAGGDKSRDL